MKSAKDTALYRSLKLTRNLINISFFIIFLSLLFCSNYNPAGVFAVIFYNALYWLLLSNLKDKAPKGNAKDTYMIELSVLKLTFPLAILLHLVLGYGFMYKISLKYEFVQTLPFLLIAIIILFRFASYLIITFKTKEN